MTFNIAIRLTRASIVAMAAASALALQNPWWAAMAVWMVGQPARGGHAHRYVLPAREGVFHGVNRLGHALTLTKVKPQGQEAKVGDIFGSWKFTNHTDGHTAVVDVNQDMTYSEGGKPIGTWLISNRQLVISYDDSDLVDRYNLPPADRKLNGTNTVGQALTLQRKAD